MRAQRAELRLHQVILDPLHERRRHARKDRPPHTLAGKLPARLSPSPNMIAHAFTPGILLT